jgi:hypothetical protein
MKRLRTIGWAVAVSLAAIVKPCVATAATSTPTDAAIAGALIQLGAAPAFNAAAVDAQRTQRQERLRAALAAFEQSFGADAATRAGWHEYLNWDAWAPDMLSGAAWETKGAKPVVKRLYDAKDGFDNPRIVELRTALTEYINLDEAVRAARNHLAGVYQRQIERLRQATSTQPHDYAELEGAAWWLTATGQAPELVAQLRSQFHAPTIVMQYHREMLEEKLDTFERTSEERRQTRNTIQKATVVGTSTVRSRTTAELVDAGDSARLRVTTSGTVESPNNRSTRGNIRVNSASKTEFTATAEIYWDGTKFVATEPQATADTRTRIRRVDAPALVRGGAIRRVNASRPAAENQAESIIEREVIDSMTERLNTAIGKLEAKSAGFLGMLSQTGNAAKLWTTAVRATSVQAGYLPGSSSTGLGALPHEMPPLEGEETLGLSINDAGIEGILRAQVAGAVWPDVTFAMLQRELTGTNTEEMLIGYEPGRWSAQWAWDAPVRIHFTDNYATVRYKFDRVEIDGSSYDAPFEVRAEMTISTPPLGFELTLRGPATVTSLARERPLPPHFQAFLEHKFRGLFGKSFHLDGMQFPAGGALDGMSVFRVSNARIEPHWVHLRYTNRPPAAAQATLVVGESEVRAAP